MDDWKTMKQAGDVAGVDRSTIARWVKAGKLKGKPAKVQDIGHVSFHQTSQELRIASPKGRFVDFVAGLYYLSAVDHETYERDVLHVVSGANVFDNGVNNYGASDDNYAVFGEEKVFDDAPHERVVVEDARRSVLSRVNKYII